MNGDIAVRSIKASISRCTERSAPCTISRVIGSHACVASCIFRLSLVLGGAGPVGSVEAFPAADQQVLASDVAGLVAGEEGDRGGHLVRLAQPTHGHPRGVELLLPLRDRA